MVSDKKTLLLPLLLITVGSGWLLSTLNVAPGINWIWTLGLAVLGLLAFPLSGFDKATVVAGPFMIVASCLSLLRQTGRLALDVEIPMLVILSGILLLIARSSSIPAPSWARLETGQER
ncbi:MAG: hypothetical protein AAF802_19465 [Planctomycetota bacterium]